jgi:hypothetical protein
METPSASIGDLLRARRAIGALFFSLFGGAWLELWAFRTFQHRRMALTLATLPIVLGAAAIFTIAQRRYRAHREALAAEAATPARQKADRLFHLINGGQWILILIAGNVLANLGLSAWVLPAVIFIIGLHFLPLAALFANPPHLVTGGALMLLAGAYPFLAPGGPGHPIGCLGAGLILWGSALWAVVDRPVPMAYP